MLDPNVVVNNVYCHQIETETTQLYLSMKDQARQIPDYYANYSVGYLEFILSQTPFTAFDCTRDFCLIPPHPTADIYRAAMYTYFYFTNERVIINNRIMNKEYATELIDDYIAERNVVHLYGEDYERYPIYQLFFLLTRYYPRPMTETQRALLERRAEQSENGKHFIDSVFYYEGGEDVLHLLSIVDSPVVLDYIGTDSPIWTKWAHEYLTYGRSDDDIDISCSRNMIEQMYNSTDNALKRLADSNGLLLPMRDAYSTRYRWIIYFAAGVEKVVKNEHRLCH